MKGDTIEVLFKVLNKYSLNYMIIGYSVYTLYLISQQRMYNRSDDRSDNM